MSVRVFAPAKINLTLKVGRPRADGMHPLQSVVMMADIGDVIEVREADTLSLEIFGDFGGALDASADNLVLRAANALSTAAGKGPGAAIALEKNLPVASGIGGGSSDAAATLQALNHLWKLGFTAEQLIDVARTLGADVPVCFAGGAAYMTGTGETWAQISAPPLAAVLVNPLTPLPTPSVYRQFDAMNLSSDLANAPTPAWHGADAALAQIARDGNDLMPPARALLPEIAEIETALRADPRTRYAGLSGSGATMFALVDNMGVAEAMADELQTKRPDWWVCETRLGA
jgi:4-diphosphocytidyl-2-C-methyl-D-erythritol kinase